MTKTGLYSLSSWASSVSSSRRAGERPGDRLEERPGERLRERGDVDLRKKQVSMSARTRLQVPLIVWERLSE